LLGVERFMSEIRAVTNLFSNIFATVVIAKWMGELDDRRLRAVLDGDSDADIDAMEEPALAAREAH
jgi:aerobic C4-dicarboxylate transport protein